MTALSEDKRRETSGDPIVSSYTVKDAEVIYEGAFVCVDANNEAVAATDAASVQFLGVAKSKVDNTDDGLTVEVERGHKERFAQDGNVAASDVGTNATLLDDATVSVAGTTTNDIKVGTIIERESDSYVWILVGVLAETDA